MCNDPRGELSFLCFSGFVSFFSTPPVQIFCTLFPYLLCMFAYCRSSHSFLSSEDWILPTVEVTKAQFFCLFPRSYSNRSDESTQVKVCVVCSLFTWWKSCHAYALYMFLHREAFTDRSMC